MSAYTQNELHERRKAQLKYRRAKADPLKLTDCVLWQRARRANVFLCMRQNETACSKIKILYLCMAFNMHRLPSILCIWDAQQDRHVYGGGPCIMDILCDVRLKVKNIKYMKWSGAYGMSSRHYYHNPSNVKSGSRLRCCCIHFKILWQGDV